MEAVVGCVGELVRPGRSVLDSECDGGTALFSAEYALRVAVLAEHRSILAAVRGDLQTPGECDFDEGETRDPVAVDVGLEHFALGLFSPEDGCPLETHDPAQCGL